VIQDTNTKPYSALPNKKRHSTRKSGSQQTGLKFKEETSEALYLEHSFEWC
jgi:hypothetical protein